jgi:hypothetical protein
MHRLLRKLGIGGRIASILMIAFGVMIFLFPDLLARLIAAYLIIVGIVKLIPEKK